MINIHIYKHTFRKTINTYIHMYLYKHNNFWKNRKEILKGVDSEE